MGQCENEANIKCYVTYDGGHSWPGGKKPRLLADPPSKKINANGLMWEFFQLHSLPQSSVKVILDKQTIPNFKLFQNFPNPFNPETTIGFYVKEKCFVKLKIFDITGREVVILANAYLEAGFYRVAFNARNLAAGVYLYRIKSKDFVDVKKMVLLE